MKTKILVIISIAVISLIIGCDSLWKVADSTSVVFVLHKEDLQLTSDDAQISRSVNFNGEVARNNENSDVMEVTISLHYADNDNEIIASTKTFSIDDETKTIEFTNLNIVGENVYAKAVLVEEGVVRIGVSETKNMSVSENYLYITSWGDDGDGDDDDITLVFIAVTGIRDVITSAMVNEEVTLTGTVEPDTATNKDIEWTTANENATITDGKLTATKAGEVIVTATIANGTAVGTDYTQNVTITVTAPEPPFIDYTTTAASIRMIAVDGTGDGSFNMGEGGSGGSVKLNNFYLGSTEVTEAQWEAIMLNWPGTNPDNSANHPARYISWYAAITFCNKLSKKEGFDYVYTVSGVNFDTISAGDIPTSRNPAWDAAIYNVDADGYRLPTEAEWEYAAGGAQEIPTLYAGTNSESSLPYYAVYSSSYPYVVKTKSPLSSAYELYDMSGNVREWCWDWFGNYSGVIQDNPTGATSGTNRVLRGGSWANPSDLCEVALRYDDVSYTGNSTYGFRVARSVK